MGRASNRSTIKSIQRVYYANTTASYALVNNTISSVDTDKSVVVHNSSNGHYRGTGAWENYYYMNGSSVQNGAKLDSSTNVVIARYNPNNQNRRNVYVEVQVVEYY
tara:strand:+ start:324 stop:641 length:318 start_codon:yes stop_codon:yes gene_type:complete